MLTTKADEARGTGEETAANLQAVLLRLIDLGLQAKQAHWNATGPNFRALHQHLDEVWETVQKHADAVAERMLALDVPARGQAADLGGQDALEALPFGKIPDARLTALMADRVARVAAAARRAVDQTGGMDLVTQDLLVEVAHDLEKHLWMFRTQI